MPPQKKFYRLCIAALVLVAAFGCSKKNPTTTLVQQSSMVRFDSTVASPALRDSLRQNKLLPGMPYFIAAQIFAAWREETKAIPVATVGRRQRLQEQEVRYRDLNALNPQIYLDEYETSQGRLALWYQYPDFYRLNVSAGDTLFVFWQNRVHQSVIEYLLDRFRLKIKDRLSDLPASQLFYGEIHHHDNPDGERSYLYTLLPDADGMTFTLESLDFELYPIERIEVNGERVTSFQWK